MNILTVRLIALLLWTKTLFVLAKSQTEVSCKANPPIDNGTFKVPLHGLAYYTCEIKAGVLQGVRVREWHLQNTMIGDGKHKEIEEFMVYNVSCILQRTEGICDRVVYQFAPNTTDLDGLSIRGCSTLQFALGVEGIADNCTSESSTISVIDSSTTQDPPTVVSTENETTTKTDPPTSVPTENTTHQTVTTRSLEAGVTGGQNVQPCSNATTKCVCEFSLMTEPWWVSLVMVLQTLLLGGILLMVMIFIMATRKSNLKQLPTVPEEQIHQDERQPEQATPLHEQAALLHEQALPNEHEADDRPPNAHSQLQPIRDFGGREDGVFHNPVFEDDDQQLL